MKVIWKIKCRRLTDYTEKFHWIAEDVGKTGALVWKRGKKTTSRAGARCKGEEEGEVRKEAVYVHHGGRDPPVTGAIPGAAIGRGPPPARSLAGGHQMAAVTSSGRNRLDPFLFLFTFGLSLSLTMCVCVCVCVCSLDTMSIDYVR